MIYRRGTMGKVIRLDECARASTKPARIRAPLKGAKVVELHRRETETEGEKFHRMVQALKWLATNEHDSRAEAVWTPYGVVGLNGELQ